MNDFYLWAGLVLFISSVFGILLILKSMQKGPEAKIIENTGQEPAAARPAAEAPAGRPAENFAAMEVLSQRLSRIEEALSRIERRLERQAAPGMAEASGELKTMIQSLKTGPEAPSPQIGQISAKVDKIYQVLTTLSGTEEK